MFLEEYFVPFGIYVTAISHKFHLGRVGPPDVQRFELIGLNGGGNTKHGNI
jgi:hypothetical protein